MGACLQKCKGQPPDPQAAGRDATELPTFSSTSVEYQDISFKNALATGTFKLVYRAEWKGKVIAVAVFKPKQGEEHEELRKELAAVGECPPHPNVVRFLGVVEKPKLCLCMEFVERGSLFNVMQSDPGLLTIPISWGVMMDMCHGVLHLHQQGVAHRDMKSLNVLIDKNWGAKLTDFGFSRKRQGGAEDKTTLLQSRVGTVRWMPPEILRGEKYNPFLADVYSTAMCLFEVIALTVPFDDIPEAARLAVKIATKREYRPMLAVDNRMKSPALVNLVDDMWRADASQRPRMNQVVLRMHELCDAVKLPRRLGHIDPPSSLHEGPAAASALAPINEDVVDTSQISLSEHSAGKFSPPPPDSADGPRQTLAQQAVAVDQAQNTAPGFDAMQRIQLSATEMAQLRAGLNK
mmetsp:Transcript_9803/g.20914  ORF Transcript_9803/g.20914 Transcript_9803/m.20914 type:complete len:406 (+) Transcript_9803:1-1218(+)